MRCWLLIAVVLVMGGCAHQQTAPAPAIPDPQSSVGVGDTTLVAISAPAGPPHPTLPEFLGINAILGPVGACAQTTFSALRTRLASRIPALEPRPAIESILDAGNNPDASPSAAIAADAKKQEDQAQQTIITSKYLARLGCCCYPDIDDALSANLTDCNELVVYETLKAMRVAADPHNTDCCKCNACCGPKTQAQIRKLAYETDDKGCFLAPSARVRRQARLLLMLCPCCVEVDPAELEPQVPEAGPEEGPAPGAPPPPPAPPAGPVAQRQTSNVQMTSFTPAANAQGEVIARINGQPVYAEEVMPAVDVEMAALPKSMPMEQRQKMHNDKFRQRLFDLLDQRLLYQAAMQSFPPERLQSIQAVAKIQQQVAAASGVKRPAIDPQAMMIAELMKQSVKISQEVSAEELAVVYNAEKDRFSAPGEIRWERISLPLGALEKKQAQEILSSLRARALGQEHREPPQFDATLLQVQTSPFTSEEQLPAGPVGEAIAALPTGAMSEIIETSQGLHIVRILQRKPSRPRTLEEVSPQLRKEILSRRMAAAEQHFVASLRRRAQVWTIFD